VKKYIYWNIIGQNPAGSWNIQISSVPTKSFRSIAFICAEKMNFQSGDFLIGHPAALCIEALKFCLYRLLDYINPILYLKVVTEFRFPEICKAGLDGGVACLPSLNHPL
jgi:hypothetical protein